MQYPISKENKSKRARVIAQVVEYLPRKHEALHSNLQYFKRNFKKGKEKEEWHLMLKDGIRTSKKYKFESKVVQEQSPGVFHCCKIGERGAKNKEKKGVANEVGGKPVECGILETR
jgi:hypothetical protein